MLTLCKSLIVTTLLSLAAANAQCPVDSVMIKGRVENAPANARVRVQLIFDQGRPGVSADTTVENGSFRVPIEFLTQSSRPLLANLKPKCERKPKNVTIKLLAGDEERDRVTLNFPHDFKMIDLTAYTPQSEVVLNPK